MADSRTKSTTSGTTAKPGLKPRERQAAREGRVVSVNISAAKGERKHSVAQIDLVAGFGAENDAHAGKWHRQVSLLALESIERMRSRGVDVSPGDFAENITTAGLDLPSLPVGTRLRAGAALLEVTQIGKKCHKRCEIYRQAGHCVMPREGIFARVLAGASLKPGDAIEIVPGRPG